MLFLIAQGCRLSPVTSTVFVVELRLFLECCDFSSRQCIFEFTCPAVQVSSLAKISWKKKMPEWKMTLLAVDGSLTSDIHEQLDDFPRDATHVFVSCGGNDAIDNVDVLNESASNVEEALVKLSQRKETFRGS